MRVKLRFLKKSEAANLLAERMEDRSMSHDLFIRYFGVYTEFTSRKRVPGWAEKLVERVELLEKEYRRQTLSELAAEYPDLKRSLEQ